MSDLSKIGEQAERTAAYRRQLAMPTWQEIAKTLAIAYWTLREFRPLAHTEQQDSDACDEDCERCAFDSAMTRIDDVLGKVCEANDAHHDGCGCEDCTLAGLQDASDAKLQCATVPVGVTIFAELSHTGQERQAVKPVDACVANLVRELNCAGVETRGSCCGHGGQGEIVLGDGYVLKVNPLVHVAANAERGWMGGGTVGGGDPDDSDREEQPIAAWIAETKATGMLDFAALEKAAELEVEPYLDALADETGKREEMIRELHGQLSCLCAAIENHPIEKENEFMKVERERARKLLEHYDSDVRGMNNRALDEHVLAHGMGQESTRDMFVAWLIAEGADDLVSKLEENGGWPPVAKEIDEP